MKKAAYLLLLVSNICVAQVGRYKVRLDQPRQVIWGLGVEIQNDAIGSGNSGLPDKVVAVPHDLTPSERQRFYKSLLKGFRYCRLAMGLYFRGLDADKKRIVERYPNQLSDLKEMIRESGMDGISMEYWSCAPAWKSTDSYFGGTIKSVDPAFLNQFADALVDDVRYMQKAGVKVSMWGLQNEPGVGSVGRLKLGNAPAQSYSHCFYSPEDYYQAYKVIAPRIRQATPGSLLMVDSWGGNAGDYGKRIQQDTALLRYVDAWVYHRIGANSNKIIEESTLYQTNTFGKPVYQNEFEYQRPTNDTLFLNTAQSVLNWFTFANSPTWFWLHALKPTYNVEASGYCLGFWRPDDDADFTKFGGIQKGHWQYNDQNYNAIAGFLTHMPWDSRRYHVDEDQVREDNRIMAYRTPNGKLVLVLTNRSGAPFTFNIETGLTKQFAGFRYTPSARDVKLKPLSGRSLKPTVPNLSVEFWVEQ